MAQQETFPGPFTLIRTRLSPVPELRAIYELYARLCRATGYSLTIDTFGTRENHLASSVTMSLAHLAQKAATSPLKGTYLYLFVHRQKPQRLLELGTHLGIGTLYLHAAAPQADLHTIEASETLARYAGRHFALIGARTKIHVGRFNEVLPNLKGPWDIIYIDGDHRGTALEAYITQLYPHLREGGWFVCDDIYWSWDMWRSWRILRRGCWKRTYAFYPFGFLQK